MKLASFQAQGKDRFGFVAEGGLIDLSGRLSGRCADLAELLAKDLVADAARLVNGVKPDFRFNEVEWLPLNPRRDARMFALGVAYKDHQLETGRADASLPSMFSKHPQSLVGHDQNIIRPQASSMYDYEGEVVLVIGKAGRHIPETRSLEHVAGYSILVDGSLRDYQKHSVTAGKNFDASSSYGPCMVTRDEIADWRKMTLTTRLNGQQVQHSAFGMLMWSVEFIVHYISTFTCLQPGDAISTGTPAGVGHRRNPQLFMQAGDVLDVEVSGVGTLRNTVVDEVV